jgi:hypothetical protein
MLTAGSTSLQNPDRDSAAPDMLTQNTLSPRMLPPFTLSTRSSLTEWLQGPLSVGKNQLYRTALLHRPTAGRKILERSPNCAARIPPHPPAKDTPNRE